MIESANVSIQEPNPKLSHEDILKDREKQIESVYSKHVEVITSIYEANKKILELIRSIEKNTLINTSSKGAARDLFYISQDLFSLLNSALDIIRSFRVSPPLGELPNISPETFNTSMVHLGHIKQQYEKVSAFLTDLEVILHNDLVSKIYGKASYAKNRTYHLTPNGIVEDRTNESLL